MATKTHTRTRKPYNRTSRLKFLVTHEGMKHAAAVQRQRRGEPNEHRFVVGNFALADGRVVLRAVMCGPAYDIPRPPVLTEQAERFNRWRTRQAAHQFTTRYGLPWHVIDLHFLDVLPDEVVALQSRGGPLSHLRDHPAAGSARRPSRQSRRPAGK